MANLYDYLLPSYNAQIQAIANLSYYIPLLSVPDIDRSTDTEFKLIFQSQRYESAFVQSEQVKRSGAARMSASISMSGMSWDRAQEWKAFFTHLQGVAGKFILYDPSQNNINQKIADSGLTFDDGFIFSDGTRFNGADIGITPIRTTSSRTLYTQLSISYDGSVILSKGTHVTIPVITASGIKTWEMKTLVEDFAGFNTPTMRFEPPLRGDVRTDENVHFIKSFGIFQLASDDAFTISNNMNDVYDVQFQAMEVL